MRDQCLKTKQGKPKITRRETQDDLTLPSRSTTPLAFDHLHPRADPPDMVQGPALGQPCLQPCLHAPVHPQLLQHRQPERPRVCWAAPSHPGAGRGSSLSQGAPCLPSPQGSRGHPMLGAFPSIFSAHRSSPAPWTCSCQPCRRKFGISLLSVALALLPGAQQPPGPQPTPSACVFQFFPIFPLAQP